MSKHKRRVLIAVHGYPPTFANGAERRAERTARALVARGFEVGVLCVESVSEPHADVRCRDSMQDGVFVRRLLYGSAPDQEAPSEEYDNPRTGSAAAAMIAEWRPDVVHLFSGYLMSSSVVRAAGQQRVPVIVSLTDYWWLCHRINLLHVDGTRCDGPSTVGCARCEAERYRRYRLPARLSPPVARLFWEKAAPLPPLRGRLGLPEQEARRQHLAATLSEVSAMIAPSHFLADTYARHGVDPARIHVSRQGVELESCLLRAPSPTLRVAFLGQIKRHKGVDLLLDAWEQLRGSRPRTLALYGSDEGERSYGRRIRARAERLPGVKWGGQLRAAEVWRALAETDVLVMPVRWVENSPNIILEAQAVGVPVVGARLGGVAELVQHEQNGLLFAPDDAADLARQLQRLLDEPSLLPKLREAPLPFRTLDHEIDTIVGLYDAVAPAPARASSGGPARAAEPVDGGVPAVSAVAGSGAE